MRKWKTDTGVCITMQRRGDNGRKYKKMVIATTLLWLVLLTGILMCLLFFRRTRRPNEPPLDRGLVPWLGHALDFGKDAAKFLSKMKAKHGDIFTVQAAGKFITVLLDPHSYDTVVWESSSKLDFGKYAKMLMERMFDVTLPDYDPAEEKAMMKMHLQNKSLPSLTKSMFHNLNTILLNDTELTSSEWKEAGLFNFTYNVMLRAGYLTLFGNESEQYTNSYSKVKDIKISEEVYNNFRKLDHLLMKAARNMLSPAEKKEITLTKEHLWHLLNIGRLKAKANRSKWLDGYQRHLEDLKVNEEMQAKVMLLQLWATQGNAGPAAFWLLLFLLKHPKAMAAVQGELEQVFKSKGQTIKQMGCISQEILDNTIIFDSALNESLRLTAAPFITREVLEDMRLNLADGRQYLLRKGDRVCLFPYVSPQMDPEIHEEPQVFKYDRFLNTDETEKKEFYKTGIQLKHYNMPWGAGNNVCVGRFHAVNSIKQFVFLLLSNFDFELRNQSDPIPDFDKSRYGFGVVQPENDIIFRFKRRVENM
ncbi:LOW QUALITY PROTEIN: prostacyclin synthase [Bombina bombina]|uniref:LOW QUALITY PROTEIN: prostacyclin synthase n=1 Tax=Bombina bombina TaxID=8345 RepID=UPI00235AD35C|nr:LOW QUALITY PROTEIN: prostacyclin synthase [Bombina bombina]